MYSYQLFDDVIALIKERYISKDPFSFFPLQKVIDIIFVVNQLAGN
jgi:hypothetical protein